jgi:hypothetical protein
MKKLVLAFSASCVTVFAHSETIVAVTNTPGYVQLDAKSDTQKLVAGTTHQTAYPESIGNPQFWFDCTRTNGWTFAANGSVAKIPSLVGLRYLTTDPESGYNQYGWTPNNPLFEANNEALGGPALDFGPKGSRRAMNFDKVAVDGGVSTNVLHNIGSVIAVWFSARGSSTYGGLDGKGTGDWGEGGYYGGALLGGGYGTDGGSATIKDQYLLYRGVPNDRQMETAADVNRPRWFDNAIANAAHTHVNIRQGHIRHNGQSTSPMHTGFSAGWEVIAVVPDAAYPLMNATGLGMNDSRISAVSGGFKVAEMLIYDKRLTLDETKRVEAYLNAKWFSRNEAGFNGNATIGRVRSFKNASGAPTKVELPVEAAAGETLTIGKLTGGRGPGSAVIKTGEGALEIGDATAYGGNVVLEAGSLAFTRKEMPTELPHDAFIHFDPSDSASFVTNASGEFLLFRNLAVHNGWKLHEICARPAGAAPVVLKDEMGAGLHMLDFGDYASSDYTRMLYFATNETEDVVSSKATPSGFTTVIAVVGAQRGGGGLIKQTSNLGYLCRNSVLPCRFDTVFFGTYSVCNNLLANQYATAMIDAVPADGAKSGFDTPAYQVIALRGPGNDQSEAIGGTGWGSGGLRLGEIVIYRRVLSQQEIRDASAYLMRKWLNREAPGYARFKDRQTPDVLAVSASESVSLDIESGNARIGTIFAPDGAFVKEGAGTLEFFETDTEMISVRGGRVVKVTAPDVSSACELAAEPALHLDVADASSMRVTEVNGERRVYEWYSQGDRTVMATIPHRISNDITKYGNDKYAPYLSDAIQLNGYDTLDFGPFTLKEGGRAMSLSRSFDAVRSAYVVWAPRDDSRGSFFGCSKGSGDTVDNLYDFLRSDTATNNAPLVQGNDTTGHVRDGQIYTNGIQVAASIVPPAGEFMLAEFHPACPAHISGLGNDRDVDRFAGGIRMAEVVLYERELSDREKIATRNYLMQKWFNAAPQALPEPEADTPTVYDIEVVGSGGIGGDTDVGARKLLGAGTFVKDGEGALSIRDLSEFNGEVVVAEGTLKITGIRPASDLPFAAADALLFHADATSGLTTVTNDNGTIEVTEWTSTLNDGWSAIPFHDTHRPTLVKADDLNRTYVVDMGKSGDKQAMRFAKNGVTNLLEGIGSVFWMLGSHNGGGYLLGGGHHYASWSGGLFNFMRGGTSGKGDRPEYSILNEGWVCPDNLKSAEWRLDGTSVSPLVTGLSGGWDLISMNITHTSRPTSNADGFAFDGRTINDHDYAPTHMGSQRLAEVLIYNRKLTDAERATTENYLRRKWSYKGTQMATTNAAAVSVAAGAMLDLSGTNQYVAAISGAGTVTNGTLAIGTLVADPTVTTFPAFKDVTVTIEPGQRVAVANAGAITPGTAITILECESITGLENLGTAIITGVSSDLLTAKLVFENGVLCVKFLPKGTLLLVR